MNHEEAFRLYGATATAYLTGTGGATGVLLLATGQVKESGVLAPECLEPDLVFPLIQARGVKVIEQVQATPAASP
jgi:saccharopine dehydrogenase-like NADP-dependent oxidoreductase